MPSIVPGFEYDIFISYRQNDNKYDGWVTEFIDNLNKELEATIKDKINLYFDTNPHDGILETHLVSRSLEDKLKCLIFIPILSRTYCDPKSFAWNNEFLAFIKIAEQDRLGLNIKLGSGNFESRVLPIRIHDLDPEDIKLVESELGFIRSVDFIYHFQGVNRPLRQRDDDVIQYPRQLLYRDQINKVANAIEGIVRSLKRIQEKPLEEKAQTKESIETEERFPIKKGSEEVIKNETEIKFERTKPELLKRSYKSTKNIIFVLLILILGIYIARLFYFQKKYEYAKNKIIPQIQKMVDENFTPPCQAFELASEAEKYMPDDSILIQLWPKISERSSLQTQPEGAKVFWKSYDQPEKPWKFIGTTPHVNLRMPLAYKRIKIEKDGFNTVLLTSLGLLGSGPERSLKLDSVGSITENMVRVPSQITPIRIVGLEKYRNTFVGEFLVDKYEVTNKEFKRFVDAGGYNIKDYWNFPIFMNGKEIAWESALNIFRDRTYKSGPANWEIGNYPEGEENYPVSGISWYEASAYANFVGKQLPTLFHWSIIAETSQSTNILPFSNFNGKSTVPVGTMEGISSYGIYDIAGNVREWCYNGSGINGESFIMGGGWTDATYTFYEAGTQPSIDRSMSNGFRCIKKIPGDTSLIRLVGPIRLEFRDYSKEKPVDDNTYNIFLRQYAYDKSPLNEQVITTADTGIWKVEKVTMDAGYQNDKLIVYLFIPRDYQPPYQPIIFFPGANAILMKSVTSSYLKRMEFIVKSGHVLVYPILKGTHERKDEIEYSPADETVLYRDHVIMWRKDIGRTFDYLETRNDIQSDKIGFFGWSWGGRMGGLYPAVEKRIKAVVLHVGGMGMNKTFPEVDPINFLPRITQPVLMLNGKNDMDFPVETSQMPMFHLLGTDEKDKKILIYNAGHLVPQIDLIRETLDWYDKYLGPVKK